MSSSSSPSSRGGVGGDGGNGSRGRGRGGDFEGPSSSRRRSGDDVWPEPFVEALALQVAVDAASSAGRLAAAEALFNLFQVCRTWRAVSGSELLWQNLTRRVWNRHRLLHDTWREEYISRHRTSLNFRSGQYAYSNFPAAADHEGDEDDDGPSCRRLAISDHHLAAGFSDGSVRLFHIPTNVRLATLRPQPRVRLGLSAAVSGIILSEVRVVFASLDGDFHVAPTDNTAQTRRARLGTVVDDGALIDFAGCDRWWVGLYAGVPGRAFQVWNAETEERIFIGGSFTDPEALMGWRQLTEFTHLVGRVRVTTRELAVAFTSVRLIVFDLRNTGIILGEEEPQQGFIVGAADAADDQFLTVSTHGIGAVRRVDTMERICGFNVRGPPVLGCMNRGYVVMFYVGGVIRVWEAEHGRFLYSLGERIGEVTAVVAGDQHVAACGADNTLHLWDYSAE
ncbi:hypothetical protein NMG60_11003331 [Bertholletia excelsa]